MSRPLPSNAAYPVRYPLKSFWLPLLVGLALMVPSLWNGLQLDDYFHWGRVVDHPLAMPGNSAWDLWHMFAFLDGDVQRTQQLIQQGLLPWWTLPEVKFTFWRPVAELTHGVDYGLWPQQPVLMHVHQLLYLLLFLVLAYHLLWWVYRRVLEQGGDSLDSQLDSQLQRVQKAQGWAFWILCLSFTHGFVAGWLANRNALLAGIFSIATVLLHHRWRVTGSYPLAVAAVLTFAAALLSAELGASAGLLLFAYALVFAPRAQALWALWPYVAIGFIWLGLRHYLGYGAFGSGHYVSPEDPMQFLAVAGERYLELLRGAWLSIPPELSTLLKTAIGAPFALGLSVLAALCVVFFAFRAVREALPWRAVTLFWVLALLLLLIPVCATVPHSRLLLIAGVPVAGLMGVLMSGWSTANATHKIVAGALLVSLLGLSPILAVGESLMMKLAMDGMLNRAALNFPAPEQGTPSDAPSDNPSGTSKNPSDKINVLINPPSSSAITYLRGVRAYHGLPSVGPVLALVSGAHPIQLTPLSASTFRIDAAKGIYDAEAESLLRGAAFPMQVGDQVMLPGLRIRVDGLLDNGIPHQITVTLTQPLQAYQFYEWNQGNLAKCRFPQDFTGADSNGAATLTLNHSLCGAQRP